MSRILAFAGRKQSGKTTCSEFIQHHVNGADPSAVVKIYNFADPLKQDICINILGLTYAQCYGEDIDKNTLTDVQWENKKLTAREVMQFVGTNLFRTMKNDVWAGATISKIEREKPDLAIIADCRFPNEVEAIKKAGGLVIKLNRNLYHSNHESEVALDETNYSRDNFDLVVNNENMTIEQQNYMILNFLQEKRVLSL